ncbi:MAG: hypothetical protein AB7W16_01780 [Candidatus Obscuribacterales bacterium]
MSKKDSASFGNYARQVVRAVGLSFAVFGVLGFLFSSAGALADGSASTLTFWVGMIASLSIHCVILTITISVLLLPFYPIYAAGHRSLTRAGIAVAALSFLAGIGTALMGAWG